MSYVVQNASMNKEGEGKLAYHVLCLEVWPPALCKLLG